MRAWILIEFHCNHVETHVMMLACFLHHLKFQFSPALHSSAFAVDCGINERVALIFTVFLVWMSNSYYLLLLFIIMYVRPSTCPEIPENSNLFLYVLKVVSLSWILWYPFLNVVLFTNVTFCLFRPTCGLLRHYVWPVCPLMHACVHAWQRYSLTCLPWTSNYYPIFVTIYFSTEKILYVHMYIESLV